MFTIRWRRLAIAGALGATLLAPASRDAPAQDMPAPAWASVEAVTAQNADPAYRALLDDERTALLRALRGGDPALAKATIGRGWRASLGYDFAVADAQAAGIRLLSGYGALPPAAMARNRAVVEAINHAASPAQQRHALFDAAAASSLFWVPEALGPRLGPAFLRAYAAGDLAQAVALVKASEIGTGAAKAHFAVPRPSAVPGSAIALVNDDVAGDGAPYAGGGGAFPSGHANVGYTDALLLAAMLPERYAPLVARADVYGFSRAVLGVHYPLDLIGSRMVAARNVAHLLADPRYRALFDAARGALRAALERHCGQPLPACAAAAGEGDPYAAAGMRALHAFTMGYGLPRTGPAEAPARVPEEAEGLIATLYPELTAAARRELLARTAVPAGLPLDAADPQSASWQRLDLYEAARAR